MQNAERGIPHRDGRGTEGQNNAWTQHAEVHGWARVKEELDGIQQAQCDGARLLFMVMRNHDEALVYKFGCGFIRYRLSDHIVVLQSARHVALALVL